MERLIPYLIIVYGLLLAGLTFALVHVIEIMIRCGDKWC
jgi:hypothetical protein